MNRITKISTLLIVFVSFFLIFSICLILSLFLIVIEKIGIEEELKNFSQNQYQYKYFEKDYLRKETSVGIVSYFEEIETFKSYDDYEHQKSILISPFGTEEYECYGTCYCEEDRRTSNSRVLVRNGISYLLAAVSSVAAVNIAQEYFSKRCAEEFSSKCQPNLVKSEISNCETLHAGSSNTRSSSSSKGKFIGEEEEDIRTFFCYAYCLDSLKFGPSTTTYRPTAESKGLDCKKLKIEGKIVVSSRALGASPKTWNLSQKMGYTARRYYQRDQLVSFCKEKSKIEYEYIPSSAYNILKNGEKSFYKKKPRKRFGHMCSGTRSPQSGKSSLQNVRCRQVDPKPRSRNSEYLDKKWWEEKKNFDEM